MAKKRLGILTGGGDCPGLNAVIRGVVKASINRLNMEVIGFHDGFLGLIERRFVTLSYDMVSGILTRGGTILGSSNKANPFAHPIPHCASGEKRDVSDQCLEFYGDLGLEALLCAGGDGTMTIGAMLAQKGARVIGLPKTIDKDLMETDITFGFDTARTVATEAIDRIHTTAQSHHRVMVVEVMGRNAGWLALESGIAGGGDIILMPEIPYDMNQIAAAVRRRHHFGRSFSIVVVAEGAKPVGGDQVVQRLVADSPDPVRLGGVGHLVAHQIEKATGIESRVTILGHIQRGGTPSPLDRLLGTQFAVHAVGLVADGQFNCMVALRGQEMLPVPLDLVMGKQRLVPLDSPLIQSALAVGTSFGVTLD